MALVLNGTSDTITGLQINSANIVDGSVTIADLATTGTASSTTFLRGDGAFAAAGGGKVLKYKQVVKTDTFLSNVNGTDITGLSVTMDAPASSSSKYLIFANVPVMASNYGTGLRLNGTTNGVILQPTGYGSRTPVSGAEAYQQNNNINHVDALCFLDSPNSASAQTYKVQVSTNGNTVKVNRVNVDGDSDGQTRGCATLTVFELSA